MMAAGRPLRHALWHRIPVPRSPTLHRRPFGSQSQSSPSTFYRTAGYTVLFALSAGLFTAYYLDARSAIHRYVFTPVLRYAFDAETGHKLAVKVLRSGLAPRDPVKDDESLRSQVFGQEIINPVGLAAGFDKDGEAIDGLFNLGFSWVEIGSVTPKPQPGNPKPRVFHLVADSALINRYGFPSQGATAVIPRLRGRIPAFRDADAHTTAALRRGSVLAINLGKNKSSPVESSEDFVTGVKTFGPYADVLVVNVSSPNTPGLRGLQNRELLEGLLADVTKARDELEPSPITSRRPRLVLKIAPDLQESQIIEVADVIRNSTIDGVIVSNTTITRPSSLIDPNRSEMGGLSGKPLKPYSLQALKTLRTHLPSSIPLIGCGGISSGADALEYARAGASLVQVYTSFGYDGVGTCRRIKDELISILRAEGKTWRGVVDEAVQTLSRKEPEPQQPNPVEPGEATIGKLIEEAEELKGLLDRLAERTE
ncbi:Dihydroorotate dehydrogenase-domain-containing protein [Boletus reticuloceps]|uniref:Dihydroorotate dehydrogenase (quinone), mitochondrial n=1 Tax=Boletus reticuloceps TaxID=495285 RepID=A0A8I3A9L6_9AGAM|nr:Dihydroorotate dehydrogenase-domain-containing protein [Boletus reticuloceps]